MCKLYAPQLPDQCAEEDAAEVREKARANFCDYFVPSETAFAPGRMTAQHRAEADLDALFGDGARAAAPADPGSSGVAADDDPMSEAEALFKE